jgi:hypothetical protein
MSRTSGSRIAAGTNAGTPGCASPDPSVGFKNLLLQKSLERLG